MNYKTGLKKWQMIFLKKLKRSKKAGTKSED